MKVDRAAIEEGRDGLNVLTLQVYLGAINEKIDNELKSFAIKTKKANAKLENLRAERERTLAALERIKAAT